MELRSVIVEFIIIVIVNAKVINNNENGEVKEESVKEINSSDDNFNGVYADCFLHMSFPCVQRKTLMYLKKLNDLSEVSVFGDYVKFVKLNTSKIEESKDTEDHFSENNSEELTHMIDRAIDYFFDNHIIRFSALGKETSLPIPNNVEEFVGRKKRKGGGGGGGGGGGHDDGGFGKKKMMMMAMMCMKMKLMMMIPAMMGMMGMMSFKGMMFSMMSFLVSKMMLIMKILEKKGGAGGGGGGGGSDGGWATGGSGGGAWMPAGGPDFGGAGGGGGGYDANGQWQSRSILDLENREEIIENKPIISYVAPVVRYSNNNIDNKKPRFYTNYNEDVIKINKSETFAKSRRKRSIIDILQNSYLYWMNKFLGINNNRRTSNNYPKYKIVNGVKYVYYPFRPQKVKMPKEIQSNRIKIVDEGFKPIITAEDFNKGEIVEGAVESRMNRKKLNKMKDSVNDTLDDNPWE